MTNPILVNRLRDIEPEIAKSYVKLIDSLFYNIDITRREYLQAAEDVDDLVNQLLGAIESAKEDRK